MNWVLSIMGQLLQLIHVPGNFSLYAEYFGWYISRNFLHRKSHESWTQSVWVPSLRVNSPSVSACFSIALSAFKQFLCVCVFCSEFVIVTVCLVSCQLLHYYQKLYSLSGVKNASFPPTHLSWNSAKNTWTYFFQILPEILLITLFCSNTHTSENKDTEKAHFGQGPTGKVLPPL